MTGIYEYFTMNINSPHYVRMQCILCQNIIDYSEKSNPYKNTLADFRKELEKRAANHYRDFHTVAINREEWNASVQFISRVRSILALNGTELFVNTVLQQVNEALKEFDSEINENEQHVNKGK